MSCCEYTNLICIVKKSNHNSPPRCVFGGGAGRAGRLFGRPKPLRRFGGVGGVRANFSELSPAGFSANFSDFPDEGDSFSTTESALILESASASLSRSIASASAASASASERRAASADRSCASRMRAWKQNTPSFKIIARMEIKVETHHLRVGLFLAPFSSLRLSVRLFLASFGFL